jgi:WD repeat-containing protein 68
MSVEPSREIYNYKAPWNIYGLSWSNRPKTFRLGLSSFIQDYCNKLVIVQMFKDSLVKVAEADHHFPITKLKWSPFKGAGPELLATTGDMLRLWEMVDPDDGTANSDRKSSYELRKTSTLCNIRKTVFILKLKM